MSPAASAGSVRGSHPSIPGLLLAGLSLKGFWWQGEPQIDWHPAWVTSRSAARPDQDYLGEKEELIKHKHKQNKTERQWREEPRGSQPAVCKGSVVPADRGEEAWEQTQVPKRA